MKAVRYDRFEGPLQLVDVPDPFLERVHLGVALELSLDPHRVGERVSPGVDLLADPFGLGATRRRAPSLTM